MKLHLDYAHKANAAPAWAWWLLAAGLLGLATAVSQYAQLKEERAGLELKLQARANAGRAPAAKPLSNEAEAALMEQTKKANAVLAELGRPWPALFSGLEAAAGKDIALLAIRPEGNKGRVRISGEARHLGDVLEYIRRLVEAGKMADVVLEEHEVAETDPQKPVRFTVTANWSH